MANIFNLLFGTTDKKDQKALTPTTAVVHLENDQPTSYNLAMLNRIDDSYPIKPTTPVSYARPTILNPYPVQQKPVVPAATTPVKAQLPTYKQPTAMDMLKPAANKQPAQAPIAQPSAPQLPTGIIPTMGKTMVSQPTEPLFPYNPNPIAGILDAAKVRAVQMMIGRTATGRWTQADQAAYDAYMVQKKAALTQPTQPSQPTRPKLPPYQPQSIIDKFLVSQGIMPTPVSAAKATAPLPAYPSPTVKIPLPDSQQGTEKAPASPSQPFDPLFSYDPNSITAIMDSSDVIAVQRMLRRPETGHWTKEDQAAMESYMAQKRFQLETDKFVEADLFGSYEDIKKELDQNFQQNKLSQSQYTDLSNRNELVRQWRGGMLDDQEFLRAMQTLDKTGIMPANTSGGVVKDNIPAESPKAQKPKSEWELQMQKAYDAYEKLDKSKLADPSIPMDVAVLDLLPTSPTLKITEHQQRLLDAMSPTSRAFWTAALPSLGGKSRMEVYTFPYDRSDGRNPNVSENFGDPRGKVVDPVTKEVIKPDDRTHAAIDIYPNAARIPEADVPVYAVISGTVLYTKGGFKGDTDEIVIQSTDGSIIRYAELAATVKAGDTIKQGEPVGNTKVMKSDTMLHIEIYSGDLGYVLGASGILQNPLSNVSNLGTNANPYVNKQKEQYKLPFMRRNDLVDPSIIGTLN